ncbi:MAG: hypothetical protein HXX15_09820 [Rhodopseudomonas sp.]|uniref:hypothetical protein n=1 Tax=Rhodopseudomonas sp. TaxID=1078 RepID=UPI00180050CF|nr:hypothetical protein [Rhodopseudomonas sp.]NVN86370.1 hypothetical protein [Rhodopseudomonas sp.]
MNITTTQRPIDQDVFNHAVSAFDDPDQVLRDNTLTTAEKRNILASWASDANAVESQPWLRLIPGAGRAVPLAAILDALRRLGGRDPPPRGGAAIRLRSRSRCGADEFTAPSMFHQISGRLHGLAKRPNPVRSNVLSQLRHANAAGAGRATPARAYPGVRAAHLPMR